MVSLCAEVQRYRFYMRARLRCGLLCWERYAQSPQLVLVANQQRCCDRCDGFRSTPELNCARSDDPGGGAHDSRYDQLGCVAGFLKLPRRRWPCS